MPYAETWTDAFNYAFIELMRDLRGVALATDWCPRMHELLSDRIFPTHTPLLLRAISYFSGTPDDIYLIPGSRIPVREERVTVEIPGSWRPVLEDCTTLQIYFDHYEITKPPLSKEYSNIVPGYKEMEAENEECSRVPAPQSAPWLVFFHKKEVNQYFYSISKGICYMRNIPEMHRKLCFGSSHGWLLMLDENSDESFLLNPITMQKIQLPSIESDQITFWILSSPPTDPDSIVIVVASNLLLFCQIDNPKWIRQVYEHEENNHITNVINCSGKLYALTFQKGLGVLDANAPLTLRILAAEKPEMPLATMYAQSYLLESCREVFLVKKIYIGQTEEFYTIEVYKMDLSTHRWEKVKSLGDCVIFLGAKNWSTSYSAIETGLKMKLYLFH
ncbi:F-box/kelch-repeat protein At1g57790-like isoform X2 [Tasmannia lanceolata]|uniref:F-box/kelch-repeat protein At1g57790-like isoform X2 n=1 Tax=Tasmannia lanceolata TaxID=3420 RepID=UPI004063AEE2